jgi:hypothetical protein
VRPGSRRAVLGAAALFWIAASADADQAAWGPAMAPGERVRMRITWAHLLAGRATLSVETAEEQGRLVLQFVAEARSMGFFAWLLRFRVEDRTVARFDPEAGCSLGIEKHLREGRARRDQTVIFDHAAGLALVSDPKIREDRFEVGACPLDVLSALFVTRARGLREHEEMKLPVFDNGKPYTLGVRFLGRERLDLPAPFGRRTPTVIVEPLLLEGTGLFVKRGRLKIWISDDERRVPVRMRAKVAVGSVSADLEAYQAGSAPNGPPEHRAPDESRPVDALEP